MIMEEHKSEIENLKKLTNASTEIESNLNQLFRLDSIESERNKEEETIEEHKSAIKENVKKSIQNSINQKQKQKIFTITKKFNKKPEKSNNFKLNQKPFKETKKIGHTSKCCNCIIL